jgi:hypothetical protein
MGAIDGANNGSNISSDPYSNDYTKYGTISSPHPYSFDGTDNIPHCCTK